MRKQYFLYLKFVILFILTLPVQAQQYHYKQICLEEGLPSTINCMLTDEHGIMWIGTKTGLGRYDSNELRMYKSEDSDPHSLPGSVVWNIIQDEQHNIWVLTNKGIARYRKLYDDFDRIVTDKKADISAYSACLIKGGVLFGSGNLLYFYSYSKAILNVKHSLDHGFNIRGMVLWDKHTVLCYSRAYKPLLIDLRNGQTSQAPFQCGKNIRALLIDSQKRIWVSPYNKGLRCFDYNGKQAGFLYHGKFLIEQRHCAEPYRKRQEVMDWHRWWRH